MTFAGIMIYLMTLYFSVKFAFTAYLREEIFGLVWFAALTLGLLGGGVLSLWTI